MTQMAANVRLVVRVPFEFEAPADHEFNHHDVLEEEEALTKRIEAARHAEQHIVDELRAKLDSYEVIDVVVEQVEEA
jgi:hypothetical protein